MADVLSDWKRIPLTVEPDYTPEGAGRIRRLDNWRLGKKPRAGWNRFSDYAIPLDRHRDSDAYLKSLDFSR